MQNFLKHAVSVQAKVSKLLAVALQIVSNFGFDGTCAKVATKSDGPARGALSGLPSFETSERRLQMSKTYKKNSGKGNCLHVELS